MNHEYRAEEIFQHVAALPKDDRAEALDRLCADDGSLRAEVESLLLADADTHSFASPLAGNHDARSPASHAVGERPGDVIGPYKLLQQIGVGGFGVVYMAQQLQPIKRRVALKVIKLGMDTKQVIARFEAERQALAMMDHPNIARVFDAGATDAGRPYFVMELIKGVPITKYCDVNNMSMTERLDLFQQVCHAVQHAHQKGIIHRDIKPSNVLVTLQDGKPVPKVIDFGIAKATNAELTEKTLFTEFQQFIGTPEYMSPEQAEMSSMDIDTRSDIYSLGVLLYELLTGTTPFDGETLRRAGYSEIQRIIREDEPPKPSTRLNTLGDRLTLVARHRKTEPGRLADALRGDLDWIVMKCLEKDRTRRYETANGLALEILRYLNDEPVIAGPPGTAYRLRKFVRRNRRAVVAGTVLTLSLMAGLVGTSTFAWRESRARRQAEQAWNDAERRKKETEQVAKFQAATLGGIDAEEMGRVIKNEFRAQVEAGLGRRWLAGNDGDMRKMTADEIAAAMGQFDVAATPANPTDVARRMMGLSVLTPAVEALERQFSEQPQVQARLFDTIGGVYQSLGVYDAAEPLLRHALELRQGVHGDEHPEVAASLNSLASLLKAKGDYAAAEPLYRQALAMRRKLLGDQHGDVAESMNDLAVLLTIKGDYAAAEPLFREALAIQRQQFGEAHADTATTLHNLAKLLHDRGDYAAAEPLYREALAIDRTLNGDQHPDVPGCLRGLASLMSDKGDAAAAEAMLREALALNRKRFGDEHHFVARDMNDLAILLRVKGDFAAAEPLFREALALDRKLLGNEHRAVARDMNNLALLLEDQGDHAAAEPLLRESLAIHRGLLGDEHPDVALCLNNLASNLHDQGDYAAAEPLYRQALAMDRKLLSDEHPAVAKDLNNLALFLSDKGDYAAAEPLAREALTMARKLLGEENPRVAMRMKNLASILHDKGDYAEAEHWYRQALAMHRKLLGDDHLDVAGDLNNLATLLRDTGDFAAAEPLFRQALAIRRTKLPPGNFKTAHSAAGLGRTLAELGRFSEAEELLLEAHQSLLSSPSGSADLGRQVLEYMVEFYDAWHAAEPDQGYDVKAAEWRAKLAETSGQAITPGVQEQAPWVKGGD